MISTLASRFRLALQKHGKIQIGLWLFLLAVPDFARAAGAAGGVSAVAIDSATGTVYSSDGSGFVVRRSAGTETWRANLGLRPQDRVLSLAVGREGEVYAAGFASGGGFLARLNSGGAVVDALPTAAPARAVATDPSGDVWLAGDGFITKLDSQLRLVSSIRFEGSVTSLAVDTNGGIYAAISSEQSGAIGKLASDARTWVWRADLGRVAPRSVVIEDTRSVYVTGDASSSGLRVVGGFQDHLLGVSDAFVARLGANGDVLWSTYLGVSGKDTGASIIASRDGTVTVAGTTASPDFPGVDTSWRGVPVGFLARLDAAGKLLRSEYIDQPVEAQVMMAGAVNRGDTAAGLARAALTSGTRNAAADPCNIRVTNTNDSGDGSLRQAVADAAACATTSNITFGVQGAIKLSSRILLNTSVNIQGPGVSELIIDGGNVTRIFFVGTGTTADFDRTVTISGLTLANGLGQGGNSSSGGGAAGMGGAIFQNGGTLKISNVLMTGNRAIGGTDRVGDGDGGGGFGGDPGGSGGDLGGLGGAAGAPSAPNGGNGGEGAGGGPGLNATRHGGEFGNGGNGGFGGGGGAGGYRFDIGEGGEGGAGGFGGGGGSGLKGGDRGGDGWGANRGGAAGFGGAVFARSGSLEISNSAFEDNNAIGAFSGRQASGKGGALFILRGTTASASGTHFVGNVAPQAGVDVLEGSYPGHPGGNRLQCPGADTVEVCGTLTGSLLSDTATLVSGDNQTALPNNLFLTQLQLRVTNNGSAVSGLPVAFTVQPNGSADAAFGSVRTIVVLTNGAGVAVAPPLTALGSTGALSVVAGGVVFHLNVVAPVITANPGTTPQTAAVNTQFASLKVTLTDNLGNPLSNRAVTFTAPQSGASGTFSNSTNTITADTDTSGVATAPFKANSTPGSYQVTASALGLSTSFSLTNTVGPPAAMTANAGTTPQATNINTAFGVPLAVIVKDASGNPVSGVNVLFTAPGSGASGVFSNGTATITVATSALGVASAPFTANGTGGVYNVTASISGLPAVTFALTNNAAPSITSSPGNLTVQALATAAFTATAGGFPEPTVKWQVSTDNGTTFTDIAGATAATYSFAANGGQTGYRYRAVFTNSAGTATSSAATLTVTKLTPSITWSNPADIVFGTPLSSTQLNATASTPGTFVYTPPGGTVLGAGAAQSLSVEFRPSDSVNYTNAQASVRINVLSQATATTVSAASGQYGDAVTLSASIAPPVPFAGTLQFQVAGVNVGAPLAVSGGGNYSTTWTITNAAGSYPVIAILTPATANFTGSSGNNTLSVTREEAAITPAAQNPQTVQVNAPGGTAGPVTLTGTVAETADPSAGDISKAAVTVTLIPAVTGTANINCTVTNTNGAISAVCPAIPVNAYTVRWMIGGGYYQGEDVNTVLAVYDPSAGFVTGSGTVSDKGVGADFALSVKYQKSGALQGGLTYVVRRAGDDVTVSTTSLTSMSIVGKTAVIIGQATVNGVGGYTLRATVTDNGEPGVNRDTFGLELSGGTLNPPISFAPGAITSGNLQTH